MQGIGYRWFVRDRARGLGLAGSVRNRPDGSVECSVQGPRPAVEQLLAALWRGPRGAFVESVEVSWEEPRAVSGAFEIDF
ncbi:MAG: acylphosphatase [Candidatus Dormibacteraeota bacterium]|nr:acylphosphatase [Candidatus Dormibacteraeota bacterium]